MFTDGQKLPVENRMFSALLDYIPDGICCCKNDEEFTISIAGAGLQRLTGYSYDEFQTRFGYQLLWLIHNEDRIFVRHSLREQLTEHGEFELECRICHKNGSILWVLTKGRLAADPTGTETLYCLLVDITARKLREQKLREQAQRDSLTGLLNKVMVKTKIDHHLCIPPCQALHAMMIIDLDDFKGMNDHYGHLCGDVVLSNFAECLRGLFRATDIVGRIGGDEFLVFLPNISQREIAGQKAKAILCSLGTLPIWENEDAMLSCSIGIAFFPEDSTDYFGLYRCADSAMYHVKNTGRAGYAFYGDILS